MDENRVEGSVRKATGKVQEGVGWVTGDAKMRAEGMTNEIRGSAQDVRLRRTPQNWSVPSATLWVSSSKSGPILPR